MNLNEIKSAEIGTAIQILPAVTQFKAPRFRYRVGQGYALHHPKKKRLILIDTTRPETKAAVLALLNDGYTIDALLLTHGDLVNQAYDELNTVSADLGGPPVYIHPEDTRGQRHATQDITDDVQLFDPYKITIHHSPGHTDGSVCIHSQLEGGLLFSGDSAVGAPYDGDEQYFERPPTHPPEDDRQLAEFWEDFDLPFSHLLPLHGLPEFNISPARAEEIYATLTRPEKTVWETRGQRQ